MKDIGPVNSSEMNITDIRIGERARKDLGDIDELAESIKRHGLIHPPALQPDGTLIAGYRRILACEKLGMTAIPVRIIAVDDLLAAERDEQLIRKAFTPSEAVAVARALEWRLHAVGRELKSAASKRRWAKVRGEDIVVGDSPTTMLSRRHAAKVVGMADKRYRQAKEVVEAAEQDSGQFGDLVEKMDATGSVLAAHTELRRRRDAAPVRHAVFRRMRHRDQNKEVDQAIVMLNGLVIGLQRIDIEELEASRVGEWSADLKRLLSAINTFYRRLCNERSKQQEPASV